MSVSGREDSSFPWAKKEERLPAWQVIYTTNVILRSTDMARSTNSGCRLVVLMEVPCEAFASERVVERSRQQVRAPCASAKAQVRAQARRMRVRGGSGGGFIDIKK
jgi:hypothetical protein